MQKEVQLGFGGEFSFTNPTTPDLSKNAESVITKPTIVSENQLRFEGEFARKENDGFKNPSQSTSLELEEISYFKKEISTLRLVSEGQRVRVRIKKRFVWTVLEEDAILKIKTSNYHKKRFLYFTRVPVKIEGRTIGKGTLVDPRRKQRAITNLTPKMTRRLRESEPILK
jgi:hypothetical protein